MKTFKLAFLCLALFSFATSCEDDDDGTTVCDQAAWVGTYTGSVNCTPGGAQDVTVTVTASGTSALNVSYVTADSTTITFTDPITYSGCGFDVTGGNQGDTLSVNATRSGDMLTLNSSLTVSDSTASVTTTCVITATKN